MMDTGPRVWSAWQLTPQDACTDLEPILDRIVRECIGSQESTMTTPVRPVPTVAPPQSPAPETLTPITLTTPEDMAQWLRTLAPEDVCGRPQWPNACPLAHYLNARNGHAGPPASVDSDSYTLADGRRRVGGIRRCMPPGRCALGRRGVIVRRRCRSRRGW